MELAEGEVQILRGPNITVTDRRIVHDQHEIPVAGVTAPQIETTTTKVSAAPTILTIATLLLAVGALIGPKFLMLVAVATAAFVLVAKINRSAFAVTVENAGARTPIYVTASENDAKLALAAVLEAQRRTGA